MEPLAIRATVYRPAEVGEFTVDKRIVLAGNYLHTIRGDSFRYSSSRPKRSKIEHLEKRSSSYSQLYDGVAVQNVSAGGNTPPQGHHRASHFRAKRRVEMLAKQNGGYRTGKTYPKFVTLTYAGQYTERAQVDNLEQIYVDFQRFIRNLRKDIPDLKYIAVPELQTETGRNAIHWHVLLFNVPARHLFDFKLQWLKDCWSFGTVDIQNIGARGQAQTKPIYYIAKYITKAGDFLPAGRRLYTCSKGLDKDILILRHPFNVKAVERALEGMEPTYIKKYPYKNKYGRLVEYEEFIYEIGALKNPPQGRAF